MSGSSPVTSISQRVVDFIASLAPYCAEERHGRWFARSLTDGGLIIGVLSRQLFAGDEPSAGRCGVAGRSQSLATGRRRMVGVIRGDALRRVPWTGVPASRNGGRTPFPRRALSPRVRLQSLFAASAGTALIDPALGAAFSGSGAGHACESLVEGSGPLTMRAMTMSGKRDYGFLSGVCTSLSQSVTSALTCGTHVRTVAILRSSTKLTSVCSGTTGSVNVGLT